MLKKMSSFLMMILFVQFAFAQTVSDYYAPAKGTCGKDLKSALYGIVRDHKQRSYNDLWQDFKKTDCRPDGKVWDMYSNVTSYEFGGAQQGASAAAEGAGYNREHSFPKSWFNEGDPMYTDLFHLYPVDVYINSMRSNYPFGETANPKKTSKNGWSKLGPSSIPGYNGTVFEPNDAYKGDFARTYFYMATRYENEIAGWSNKKGEVFPMLNSTCYPVFSEWALKMLLRWSAEDPVDQKEIDRNNVVYGIQNNRNPYIDYPGLEQYVWGSKTSTSFDPDNYIPGNDSQKPGEQAVAAPVFSIQGGKVKAGTGVVLSCATGGAAIFYQMNGGEWQSGMAPVAITISENAEVVAYAKIGDKKSEVVHVSYTISDDEATSGDVFVKISGVADLVVGNDYLIVCEDKCVAMSETSGKDYRFGTGVTITSDKIQTTVSQPGFPSVLTLGGTSAGYTFYDAASQTYLSLTSNGNKLYDYKEIKADASQWTVTFSDGGMLINNNKYPERRINYNANSGQERFAAYKATSGQLNVVLYKQTQLSAIEYTEVEKGAVDVYSLNGVLLRNQVDKTSATNGLPRGMYVVGGVKILVK